MVGDRKVTVRTRRGHDVTSSVPEIGPLGDETEDLVLDGELVFGAGLPTDFYGLTPRMAARWPKQRVTFVAFDVLAHRGETLLRWPYTERRDLLERLQISGPAWTTTASYDDGPELFAACVALGLEGVVAKRKRSVYQPGKRSTDWRKVKTPGWSMEHAPLRGGK